jgi:calpain-7
LKLVFIKRIIYPQNKNGEPIYNPCGKYMISLTLNGCPRKVTVDDYLPVDKHNNLLCSMTTNKGELWVSLLEKAYMKVMGGYDFPGSNSNIDLHALTNWIPERLPIHGQHTDFNRDADFERMFERFHRGDCLITVATNFMDKNTEEKTGLVSTHAYAVLDIRKFKNKRLFEIKNPWSHLRWKGNFSEYDRKNWTEELKQALNYDPNLACNVDNGIFWIDYESLLQFFDVFYLSWNPALFSYTSCFHKKWSSAEGPIKDRYNLGENPQYILKIKPSETPKKCTTWLLLTRHITDKVKK